jgi:hypothetical protein
MAFRIEKELGVSGGKSKLLQVEIVLVITSAQFWSAR